MKREITRKSLFRASLLAAAAPFITLPAVAQTVPQT